MSRRVTERPWKPTREQLAAAANKTVPDLIAPNLKVLFAGINPGLYTAAIGHHFGRPGNRFWPALYASGFTPRVFSPFEERELLPLGYGITNVVNRATASADELSPREFQAGATKLGDGSKNAVHEWEGALEQKLLGGNLLRVSECRRALVQFEFADQIDSAGRAWDTGVVSDVLLL